MRRLPPWALALVPLTVGALYALAHPLFAPRPDLEDVVPGAAVLTARYRGLAGLDALWCFGRQPGVRPSEDLADRHNLPGFAGVDPSGAFHWVLLPRSGRADATLLIVPVADAERLRARFELRDGALDASRAYRRHAKQLEIRGSFAALAWDRDVARRLGEGGLTLADRGEDFGLALDVSGALALALTQPAVEPWRGILEALGAEPAKATLGTDRTSGLRAIVFPFGRAERVADAWSTARLWAWSKEQRIEVELEPKSAALRALLARVPPARVEQGPALAAGPGARAAEAVVWIPGREAFAALALALSGAGVDLPEGLPPAAGDGELYVRAFASPADPDAWTLEVWDPMQAYDAPLGALIGPLPEPGASLPLAAGAAPVTVATTRRPHVSPAGTVSRSATGERLLIGADAQGHAQAEAHGAGPEVLEPAPTTGRGVLAVARLNAQRALALLGPALQPGGLFAALGLGELRVLITTDGQRVFVTLDHGR
jgi:hypothetical protein